MDTSRDKHEMITVKEQENTFKYLDPSEKDPFYDMCIKYLDDKDTYKEEFLHISNSIIRNQEMYSDSQKDFTAFIRCNIFNAASDSGTEVWIKECLKMRLAIVYVVCKDHGIRLFSIENEMKEEKEQTSKQLQQIIQEQISQGFNQDIAQEVMETFCDIQKDQEQEDKKNDDEDQEDEDEEGEDEEEEEKEEKGEDEEEEDMEEKESEKQEEQIDRKEDSFKDILSTSEKWLIQNLKGELFAIKKETKEKFNITEYKLELIKIMKDIISKQRNISIQKGYDFGYKLNKDLIQFEGLQLNGISLEGGFGDQTFQYISLALNLTMQSEEEDFLIEIKNPFLNQSNQETVDIQAKKMILHFKEVYNCQFSQYEVSDIQGQINNLKHSGLNITIDNIQILIKKSFSNCINKLQKTKCLNCFNQDPSTNLNIDLSGIRFTNIEIIDENDNTSNKNNVEVNLTFQNSRGNIFTRKFKKTQSKNKIIVLRISFKKEDKKSLNTNETNQID